MSDAVQEAIEGVREATKVSGNGSICVPLTRHARTLLASHEAQREEIERLNRQNAAHRVGAEDLSACMVDAGIKFATTEARLSEAMAVLDEVVEALGETIVALKYTEKNYPVKWRLVKSAASAALTRATALKEKIDV